MKKKFPYMSPRFDEGVLKRRNRRRMAWISLISMIAIVFALMFSVDEARIPELSTVIDTIFWCLSSIVLGYLGIATWDDQNIMKTHLEQNKLVEKKKEENEDDLIKQGPKK